MFFLACMMPSKLVAYLLEKSTVKLSGISILNRCGSHLYNSSNWVNRPHPYLLPHRKSMRCVSLHLYLLLMFMR